MRSMLTLLTDYFLRITLEPTKLHPLENDRLMRRHKVNHAKFDNSSELVDGIELYKSDVLGLPGRPFLEGHNPTPGSYGMYVTSLYLEDMGLTLNDIYNFNSFGFRSQEFESNHEGLHVVFIGCSVTLGEAMFEDYSWPKVLYDKLSKKEKLSGYFNLAKSSYSMTDCYNTLDKYIELYGTPDVVFANFPDLERDSGLGVQPFANLIDSKKIGRFVSMTWDPTFDTKSHDDARNSIDGIIKFDNDYFNQQLFEYENDKIPLDHRNFILKAMDDSHPGIAQHAFYANMMYNSYYEKTITQD